LENDRINISMSSATTNLICIKTVQATVIKNLVDDVKELLSETNIRVDETGLHILSMDESQTVMVNLDLHADEFEEFYCARPRVIGVNMVHLNRILKTIQPTNTFELFVTEEEENQIHIRLTDASKSQVDEYVINQMDIDEQDYAVPDQEYDHTVIMPSSDFHQIVRSSKSVSAQNNNRTMEIISQDGRMTFKVKGDIGDKKTDRHSGDNSTLQYARSGDVIYQDYFNLEKLIEFSKCANLGTNQSTVEIRMKSEHPIVLCYPVSSLGSIVLLLAPRENP